MEVIANVVHAEKFTSRKDGKVFTKLFVPIGFEVAAVIAAGDVTALAGVEGVTFELGMRDGQLRLYYRGEEDT